MRNLASGLLGAVALCWSCGQPGETGSPSSSPDRRAAIERCDDRLDVGAIENVSGLAWSPDSRRLAFRRDVHVSGNFASAKFDSRISVLSLDTSSLADVGRGLHPQWSESGTYLSYWTIDGRELVVTTSDSGDVITRFSPSVAATGWRGERLLYWRGAELREWSSTADRALFSVPADLTPNDGQRNASFSADGERFAIAEFGDAGGWPSAFVVGATSTGVLEPRREHAGGLYWAGQGHEYAVLNGGPALEIVGDVDARSVTLRDGERFVGFGADVREILVRESMPRNAYEEIDYERLRVIDPSSADGELTLPVLGMGAMSRGGHAYAGTRSAGWHGGSWLEVFRCATGRHVGSMAANWLGVDLVDGGFHVQVHAFEDPELASRAVVDATTRLGAWGWSCSIERVGPAPGGGDTWSGVGDDLRTKAAAPYESTGAILIGSVIASTQPLPPDHVDLTCGVRDEAGAHGARVRASYDTREGRPLIRTLDLVRWR